MIANLIAIIIGIVFIAFFAGFNLDNKCDVSLVFYTFKQIPVFFTILISFAVGLMCSLPFALVRRSKKSKQIKNAEQKQSEKLNKKQIFGKKTEKNANTTNFNPQSNPEAAKKENAQQTEVKSDSETTKNQENSKL